MSDYIIVKNKIKVNKNGRIFKPWTEEEILLGNMTHMLKVIDILAKQNFDFYPNILTYNEKGYSYEYVEGNTIDYEIHRGALNTKDDIVNTKYIYEIKIAMDNIWRELYNLSMKLWNGKKFLYHSDLHLGNLIWKPDSKELMLLDLNGVSITEYIPFSYSFYRTFLELEARHMAQIVNRIYHGKKYTL